MASALPAMLRAKEKGACGESGWRVETCGRGAAARGEERSAAISPPAKRPRHPQMRAQPIPDGAPSLARHAGDVGVAAAGAGSGDMEGLILTVMLPLARQPAPLGVSTLPPRHGRGAARLSLQALEGRIVSASAHVALLLAQIDRLIGSPLAGGSGGRADGKGDALQLEPFAMQRVRALLALVRAQRASWAQLICRLERILSSLPPGARAPNSNGGAEGGACERRAPSAGQPGAARGKPANPAAPEPAGPPGGGPCELSAGIRAAAEAARRVGLAFGPPPARAAPPQGCADPSDSHSFSSASCLGAAGRASAAARAGGLGGGAGGGAPKSRGSEAALLWWPAAPAAEAPRCALATGRAEHSPAASSQDAQRPRAAEPADARVRQGVVRPLSDADDGHNDAWAEAKRPRQGSSA